MQSVKDKWSVIDRVADKLGVPYSSRHKWRSRQVPHRWRLPLIEASGGLLTFDDFTRTKQKVPSSPPRSEHPRKIDIEIMIDADLADEALTEGINMNRLTEKALREAVSDAKAKRWQQENKEVIAAWNQELEENGLWSDGLRQF